MDVLTNEYSLPIGYKDEAGKVHREVRIKEMCGYDEEYMFNAAKKMQPLVALLGLLERLVISIGDIKPVPIEVFKKLLIGDLNYLVVAIRIEAMGKDLEFAVKCPSCEKQGQYVQDLKELEITTLNDDADKMFDLELEKGYTDSKQIVHKSVKLKYLTVSDQLEVSTLIDNPARAINMLLTKSIVQLGSLLSVNQEIVKSLVKRDRDKLLQEINKKTPGINLVVEVPCSECNFRFKIPIGIENFFGYRAI